MVEEVSERVTAVEEQFSVVSPFSELGLFEVRCTKLCITRCSGTVAGVACAPAKSPAFMSESVNCTFMQVVDLTVSLFVVSKVGFCRLGWQLQI